MIDAQFPRDKIIQSLACIQQVAKTCNAAWHCSLSSGHKAFQKWQKECGGEISRLTYCTHQGKVHHGRNAAQILLFFLFCCIAPFSQAQDHHAANVPQSNQCRVKALQSKPECEVRHSKEWFLPDWPNLLCCVSTPCPCPTPLHSAVLRNLLLHSRVYDPPLVLYAARASKQERAKSIAVHLAQNQDGSRRINHKQLGSLIQETSVYFFLLFFVSWSSIVTELAQFICNVSEHVITGQRYSTILHCPLPGARPRPNRPLPRKDC